MQLLADGMLHPAFARDAFNVVKTSTLQGVAVANQLPKPTGRLLASPGKRGVGYVEAPHSQLAFAFARGVPMSDFYDSNKPGGAAPDAQAVTWTNTMAAIFIKFKPCMDVYYPAIDLSSYASVMAQITAVASAISNGVMPENNPKNPPPAGPDYVGMWADLNGTNLFGDWQANNYAE